MSVARGRDVIRHQQPIAVFDSGLGGLTVVRALRRRLPDESIVYFGDTARVPYGPKSAEVVTRFTREIIHFLLRFDPKCIVLACNTASAVALPKLDGRYEVPVIGTIGPGAAAAVEAAGDGLIAVIATEATIASNQYRNVIQGLNPRVRVVQKACPLFVPLVEEGRDERNGVVRAAVAEYLEPVRRLRPAVAVLGCTHYPLLRGALADFMGEQTVLIDTGDATAAAVERLLRGADALSGDPGAGRLLCYVSDDPQRFGSLSARFLGHPIMDVVRVCPEEFYVEPAPVERMRVSA
jgi:glutamate racemase